MTGREYYGYTPVANLDIGHLTSELAKTLSGIQERRTLEKEQLDQIKDENIKTIQELDYGKSQTFQTMALNASQDAVKLINTWNKELKAGRLKPNEYKQKMNTISENWGTFANTVKTYDDRMAEIQKQQQDGSVSGISVSMNEFFAQSSELKDKQIFWDPNTGAMSMGKIDPNTGLLDPQSIMSAKSMALPNNMIFDKVQLDQTVNDVVKLWEPYIEENDLTTIESVKKNPDIQRKIADLVGGLTSNPRLTASILVDNLGEGYDVYVNQRDFYNKLGSMIQNENEARRIGGEGPMTKEEENQFAQEASDKLIEMRMDATGTYQPVLKEGQINRAKDAIETSISSQLGFKVTQDEPRSYTSRGNVSGGGGGSKEDDYDSTTVDNILSYLKSGNWNGLSSLAKSQYYFRSASGGKFKVYKHDPNTREGQEENPIIASPYDMGKYFGYSNLDKWKKYVDYSRNKENKPVKFN